MSEDFTGESGFDSVEETSQKIEAAETFEELFAVLREIKGIQGTQEYYDAESLINDINLIRSTALQSPFLVKVLGRDITRSHGLRDKCIKLLQAEVAPIIRAEWEQGVRNVDEEHVRQEAFEKLYSERLAAEYGEAPASILSTANMSEESLEKFSAAADVAIDESFKEMGDAAEDTEDVLFYRYKVDILTDLTGKGLVEWGELEEEIKLYVRAHIASESLHVYAARKAWAAVEKMMADMD